MVSSNAKFRIDGKNLIEFRTQKDFLSNVDVLMVDSCGEAFSHSQGASCEFNEANLNVRYWTSLVKNMSSLHPC